MRSSVFISVCVLSLFVRGEVRFTEPVWRPDLDLRVPTLRGAQAEPLDLPEATSFLVGTGTKCRLEDRFSVQGLWLGHTLRARWSDDAGNMLFLARLTAFPPADNVDRMVTRTAFRQGLRVPDKAETRTFLDACVQAVSPVEVKLPAVRPRRAQRRNLAEIFCYPTTNAYELVYVFRPKNPDHHARSDWYMAALVLEEGEDVDAGRAWFDEGFLDALSVPSPAARSRLAQGVPVPRNASERDWLRADVRANVANYDGWHCTDAEDVTVVDDLEGSARSAFVASLTNNLPRLRRAYAACCPSPLAATNQLAVVRVFRNRAEYLNYAGEDKDWTAAYWSPLRRELVLYLPESGETAELLRTVWHEAFHQYLDYATAMASASPWFNEGHAQLFQQARCSDAKTGTLTYDPDRRAQALVQAHAENLARLIPCLLMMDYEAFYDGTPEEVEMHYALAWSLVWFLEKGAPELRFQPFAKLRADYLAALVETRDMHKATQAVLNEKSRNLLIAAWLAFWRR